MSRLRIAFYINMTGMIPHAWFLPYGSPESRELSGEPFGGFRKFLENAVKPELETYHLDSRPVAMLMGDFPDDPAYMPGLAGCSLASFLWHNGFDVEIYSRSAMRLFAAEHCHREIFLEPCGWNEIELFQTVWNCENRPRPRFFLDGSPME